MGSAAFRLTAAGWLRAMLLSGTADTTDCRERCARLAQALKSVVKGRNSHYDGLTTEHEIASTAHLPVGWVFNALKSRLLGVVFPKDRWDATIDKRTIRVKPSFSNRVRRRRTVLGSTSITLSDACLRWVWEIVRVPPVPSEVEQDVHVDGVKTECPLL